MRSTVYRANGCAMAPSADPVTGRFTKDGRRRWTVSPASTDTQRTVTFRYWLVSGLSGAVPAGRLRRSSSEQAATNSNPICGGTGSGRSEASTLEAHELGAAFAQYFGYRARARSSRI